jgi:hypothetical protein
MRLLRSDADLTGIAFPLRRDIDDCLIRWSESGVPYDPTDTLIVLVEIGDSVDAVAKYVSGIADDSGDADDGDFAPPAEWTTDRGCAYEMFICLNDDGAGFSIFIPKIDGIDPLLLELCTAYVTQQPALT